MQGHSQFAEQLWDKTAKILARVSNGLESTEQLSDFFKGRQKAEEESAKQMRMMCMVSVPRVVVDMLMQARLASGTSNTSLVYGHDRADFWRTR